MPKIATVAEIMEMEADTVVKVFKGKIREVGKVSESKNFVEELPAKDAYQIGRAHV